MEHTFCKPLDGGLKLKLWLVLCGQLRSCSETLFVVALDSFFFSFALTWAHSISVLFFSSLRFSLSRKLYVEVGLGCVGLGGGPVSVFG